jgi:hypothetical protein
MTQIVEILYDYLCAWNILCYTYHIYMEAFNLLLYGLPMTSADAADGAP